METNYLTDAFQSIRLKGTTPTSIDLANELRDILGDERVLEVYNDLKEGNESEYYVQSDYSYYWVASKLIEMDKNGESADGLSYPDCGWIDGMLWDPLNLISGELSAINGISAFPMAIYKTSTKNNTKGFISIRFYDWKQKYMFTKDEKNHSAVEVLNEFLWAGCHRYFGLTDSKLWRLVPDISDPNKNSKDLKFELHYLDLTASKEKMEKDFKELAKGIQQYYAYTVFECNSEKKN